MYIIVWSYLYLKGQSPNQEMVSGLCFIRVAVNKQHLLIPRSPPSSIL